MTKFHKNGPQGPGRTALGEYIPAPGGRPLTALAAHTPGPADYELPDMGVHKPNAPDYTIRNKYPEPGGDERRPSPTTYHVKLPACHRPLLPTLKPLIEPPDYSCSPGPVHLVRYGNVDTKPGRTTLKGRHSPSATAGHPCPIDRTSYTETPAPVYSPVTAHLPRAPRFLLNDRPPRADDTPGPGPGRRNLRRALSGPHYSIRHRPQQLSIAMDNPPPDWYFVQDVLPAVHAPKMGERLKPRRRSPRPAPNAYKVPRRDCRAPEMTFRPFEGPPAFQTPGPGAYSPEQPPKRRAPAYSIRLPVPAAHPSGERPSYGRGPAAYDVRTEPRRRPAFKLTRRPASARNDFPAPNAYTPHEAPGTNNGFSLRIKPADFKRPTAPAPNKYLPRRPLPRAPEYSLRIRHRDMSYKEKESVPAPDAYCPPADCGCGVYLRTTPGASLKSRPSKYLFTGYDRARAPLPMSQEADRKRVPFA